MQVLEDPEAQGRRNYDTVVVHSCPVHKWTSQVGSRLFMLQDEIQGVSEACVFNALALRAVASLRINATSADSTRSGSPRIPSE